MTNVIHLQKEGEGNSVFLLTDRQGDYFMQGGEPFSSYCGLFMRDDNEHGWSLFKSIESIGASSDTVKNNLYNIERSKDGRKESFVLQDKTLIYTTNAAQGSIVLDCRPTETIEHWGRVYQVTTEPLSKYIKTKNKEDLLIITYLKYTDQGMQHLAYTYYVVISGLKKYSVIENWEQRHYPYDALRKCTADYYVFHLLDFFDEQTLCIAADHEKEEAIKTIVKTRLKFSEKKHQKELLTSIGTNYLTVKDPLLASAYACCLNQLNSMHIITKSAHGLYAGLPWFYQFWARDESIATKALMLMHKNNVVKDILDRQLSIVLQDGRIPNRFPASALASADGVGWACTRLHDFLLRLQCMKKIDSYYTLQELVTLQKKIDEIIARMGMSYGDEDGLLKNERKETWIDTDEGNDPRNGVRIEVQALWLRIHALKTFLDDLLANTKKKNVQEQNPLVQVIRQHFFKKGMLADGKDDFTARPNIFLAYYLAPELLAAEEWKTVFDWVLSKIWLEWGGLSTIDKQHPSFQNYHTGMDNLSYHRGDSWFWINNLAALCMYRLDKEKYKTYIEKILDASANEILFFGCIGQHAEISDAAQLSSRGCLSQTWSAALFIELMEELKQDV
ncbi:MAG: amylo-alpha-1,6-glucosidase [archaeon]